MAERGAFTLIELLVVMLIIATLAGLLLVGVMGAFGRTDVVKVKSDIQQIDTSLMDFKQTYTVFPPSRIKLCKRYSDYGTTPLDVDSIYYLTRLAGRIGDNTPLVSGDPNYNASRPRTKSPWRCTNTSGTPYAANIEFVDWDGSGQYDPANPSQYTVVLEGDQ
jgi:prepilin-type N-terminal cleavage/methylation domain-containing protein